MLKLEDLSLLEITPPNLKKNADVKAVSLALDDEIGLITKAARETGIIYAVDNLPASVLDLLAFQFHVDFYDTAATLEMKREMIRGAIQWHMKKGTSSAIIHALKMIGIDAEFLHWHETGDAPYTFRIRAEITGDFYRTIGRDKIIERIRKAVDDSKAARSYMTYLETNIHFEEKSGLFIAEIPFLSGCEIIKLTPPDPPDMPRVYYAQIKALQGNKIIGLDREKIISGRIYAGLITAHTVNEEIGVDLSVMQELILQFEKRVFQRLENLQADVNSRIEAQNRYIAQRFNELEDLLRWKGDDETL